MIKGVIFDLDGTILNSFVQRVKAWKMSFADQGIYLDDSDINPLIGLPGLVLASKFSSDPELTEKLEEKYFLDMLKNISIYEDFTPTISTLESIGIKSIIVTSSRRELVNKLDLNGLSVVTIDDVSSGKPGTEPYLLATKNLGIPIEYMMAVGDSINDMIPARKLGIPAILVTHGRETNIKLFDHKIGELSEIPELIKKNLESPF